MDEGESPSYIARFTIEFILRAIEKMSNEDIAAKENWSVASVKRHKGRLIDILSASLYGADVTELLT